MVLNHAIYALNYVYFNHNKRTYNIKLGKAVTLFYRRLIVVVT